jgi:uncharacterized protein (TIGR02996 family)
VIAESQLVDAIRADLDDDAPRLVYADAIAARDPERGELIALQCAIAAAALVRADAIAARRRVAALLAAHGDRWADLAGIARHRTFERGFVHRVSADVAVFADRGDELVARAPGLYRVELDHVDRASPDTLERAARSPALRGVRMLGISNGVTAAIVDRFRRAGALPGLAGLALGQLGYRDPYLGELARAGELTHLRELELRILELAELAALADAGVAPRRFFAYSPRPDSALAASALGSLARDAIDLGLLDRVGDLPAATRARLRTAVVSLGDPTLPTVELPELRQLHVVDSLFGRRADPRILEPLVAARGIRPRELGISTHIPPGAIAALAASPAGSALEELDVRGTGHPPGNADASGFDGVVLR